MIAQQHKAKMIGKLYGETTAVVYFSKPVPLGTYAIRSQIGDRFGLARVRRHPSNPYLQHRGGRRLRRERIDAIEGRALRHDPQTVDDPVHDLFRSSTGGRQVLPARRAVSQPPPLSDEGRRARVALMIGR